MSISGTLPFLTLDWQRASSASVARLLFGSHPGRAVAWKLAAGVIGINGTALLPFD